jgi:hypothetical protein
MEVYQKIENYQRYSISNLGRVRNDVTGRILKAGINSHGYQNVKLTNSNTGKQNNLKVHRLVCQAFHDNPNGYKCVDHIDRNKQNNHLRNLRWASHQMNARNRTSRRNSTVDHLGVCYDEINNCYKAQILDGNGKRHSKSFSVKKYGKERALLLAKVARSELEYQYWDVDQ